MAPGAPPNPSVVISLVLKITVGREISPGGSSPVAQGPLASLLSGFAGYSELSPEAVLAGVSVLAAWLAARRSGMLHGKRVS